MWANAVSLSKKAYDTTTHFSATLLRTRCTAVESSNPVSLKMVPSFASLSVCVLFARSLVHVVRCVVEGRKCLVKCLFVFGLTKAERAQVGDDVRTFRRAKHPALLALQDVVSEPEVSQQQNGTSVL